MADTGVWPARAAPRPATTFDSDSVVQAAHLLGDNPIFVVEWQTRRILSCNAAVQRVFGYSPSELVGGDTRKLHVSEDTFRTFAIDSERHFGAGATSYQCRFEMCRRNGTRFPTENMVQVVHDSRDGPLAVVSIVRDLTECLERAAGGRPAFRYAEPHWLAMDVPGAIFRRIRDGNGDDRYTYIAGRMLEQHGTDPTEARRDPGCVFARIESADHAELEQALAASHSTLASVDLAVRYRPPDGEQLWLRVICRPHRRADGATVWDGLALDITREKHAEWEAHWFATHDSLTGLINRARFVERLEHAVERARADNRHVAVAHVGVRGMLQLNEAHGFAAGDALLAELAARLCMRVDTRDLVARSHGDIFLIMLDIAECAADLGAAVAALRSVCDAPFEVSDGVASRTGLTIGIARFPEDGDSADGLVRAATLAAGRAHARPEVDYEFYARGLSDELRQRFELERRLRDAIAEQRLEPYFQPQVALADGGIVGLEALVRWPLGEGQVASPGEFVPLAERTGLIHPLGTLVLRRVAACVEAWVQAGRAVPPVAVNCSAQQFRASDFVDTYRGEIVDRGIDPALVALEITESTLVEDFAATEHIMAALGRFGVRFAIDDFGTGFSSLGYLTRLPFHVLKIDRSFIASICDDTRQRSIVRALVEMAGALELYVIAEGVETEAQEAEVRRLGCHAAQGFRYSPPLPADRVATWLA